MPGFLLQGLYRLQNQTEAGINAFGHIRVIQLSSQIKNIFVEKSPYLNIQGFVFTINHGCETRGFHLTAKETK